MSELKEAALSYAGRGWYVFPLYGIKDGRCECLTNCGSPGKHPRTKNGLKDATVDVNSIKAWWDRWPDSNVAIATGSVSDLYVIDVDAKRSVEVSPGILIPEGQDSILKQQRLSGDLPDTLTSLTGSGGTHFLFAYPTPNLIDQENASFGNRAGILPSVDTRGDGGYIVVPPSLHQSGNRYRWQDSALPTSSLTKPWLTFLTSATSLSTELSLEPSESLKIKSGEGQHEWLFKMGSLLRGQHGLGATALEGAIKAYDLAHLSPPLAETDPGYISHVVKQVMKYPQGLPPSPIDLSPTDAPSLDRGESRAEAFIDFMLTEPENFTPLVGGLLNDGETMIIGGQPNIGKSWIIMDMMLGIAEGSHFARHFNCHQGRVLFIDEEGSRRGNWERFQMLLHGRDTSGFELPIFSKIGAGLRLDSPRGHAAVSRLLDEHRPSVVFMDSLVRMHAGAENDNRVMASFFELVKKLQNAYGSSFVFTHHVGKPPAQGKQEPWAMLRGASDIQGFPDSVMVVMPGMDTAEVKVIHTKMRNGPKIDPFTIRMQIDTEDGKAQLGYLKHEDSITYNKTRELIKSKLSAGGATTEHLAMMTGLSQHTVMEHVKVMAGAGFVTMNVQGGTHWMQLRMEDDEKN